MYFKRLPHPFSYFVNSAKGRVERFQRATNVIRSYDISSGIGRRKYGFSEVRLCVETLRPCLTLNHLLRTGRFVRPRCNL